MTEKQLNIIKAIINKDCSNLNSSDLKILRDYINEKIKQVDDQSPTVNLTDSEFNDKIDILLKEYQTFCRENINSPAFRRNSLSLSFCNQNGIPSYYGDENMKLKVYHTLGLNREKILASPNISDATLNRYNELLQAYGLSLNTQLTRDQIKTLNLKANNKSN